jgi:anti-sigma factor (TIGR02949 family)
MTVFHPKSSPNPYDPFGPIDMSLGGDCSAMVSRLGHFLDGELTEQRRVKIQMHLDACPSCFSAFDFEAELRVVVRTRTVTEVPPDLAARIRLALFRADASD